MRTEKIGSNHLPPAPTRLQSLSSIQCRTQCGRVAQPQICSFLSLIIAPYPFAEACSKFLSLGRKRAIRHCILSTLALTKQVSGHDLGRAVKTLKNKIPHAVGLRTAQRSAQMIGSDASSNPAFAKPKPRRTAASCFVRDRSRTPKSAPARHDNLTHICTSHLYISLMFVLRHVLENTI
jgi:hypothetical protein